MTCPGHCDQLFKTMPKVREHLRGVFDSTVKAAQRAKENEDARNVAVDDSGDAEVATGTKRKHDEPLEATQTEVGDGPASDVPHPSKKQHTASSSADSPEEP